MTDPCDARGHRKTPPRRDPVPADRVADRVLVIEVFLAVRATPLLERKLIRGLGKQLTIARFSRVNLPLRLRANAFN